MKVRSVKFLPNYTFSLKQKARRVFDLRRARGWGGHPSFFLDSHVAKFVRVILGDEQVRASQDKQ
jgi:hypothetical protein